jgi:hypothetical protein
MIRLVLISAVFAIAGCASGQTNQVAYTPGGFGKPCPSGVGMCFQGGNYPASYLAEGGNPDKGTDGK